MRSRSRTRVTKDKAAKPLIVGRQRIPANTAIAYPRAWSLMRRPALLPGQKPRRSPRRRASPRRRRLDPQYRAGAARCTAARRLGGVGAFALENDAPDRDRHPDATRICKIRPADRRQIGAGRRDVRLHQRQQRQAIPPPRAPRSTTSRRRLSPGATCSWSMIRETRSSTTPAAIIIGLSSVGDAAS